MTENKFRCTVFVPVGTSLIAKAKEKQLYSANVRRLESDLKKFKNCILKVSNNGKKNIQTIRWQRWRDCYQNSDHSIKFFDIYNSKVCPDIEIKRRKRCNGYDPIDEQHPDKLTAELASLHLFYEEMNSAEVTSTNQKDEILLLASDTDQGLYCACFLADYLMQKEPYKDQIGKIHVERIIGLVGSDSDVFGKQGLDNLVSQTTELIQERQGKSSLYLNVTGGYKGVLPYLVLLGLAFGEMEIFYLFELSPQIVWPPKLPVGFDLLTWRDYRAFIRSITHIEGLEEKDLEAFIPDAMRMLLEREKVVGKFPLTKLGEVLRDKYEEARGREISEYGRGYLLTDKINNPQKQQALKDCIDRWQYLWLGDLIPETVEHARGHAQRDLELLAQIIYPILNKEPNFFSDEGKTDDNLLVLLSSIWLHDLGHSGDYLKCAIKRENKNRMIIKDGGAIKRDIKGFPSLVRDIHHLLSWYLIGKDKNELFKSKCDDKWVRDESVFDDNLIEAIRQVCLYNRGKMPGSDGPKLYEHIGIKIEKPLKDLKSDKVNLPLLGVLLRIADAGEVQRERTISEEYEVMRILQNNREIERLKTEERSFREIVKTVFNGDSKPSLPDYLKFTMNIAEKYFSKENANAFELSNNYLKFTEISKESKKYKELGELRKKDAEKYKDTYLDYLVDKCVQKFIQKDDLDSIDEIHRLFLWNWLSTFNQFIFKKRQPAHFDKHRGIGAIMYLLERTDKTKDDKNEYHFKVLAIHRKSEDQEENNAFIQNVKKVLVEDIKEEYGNVQKILNDNRIFFDSYCMMEEGKDKMVMV